MHVWIEVRKNAYYDSVALMRVTKEVEKTQGIEDVLVGMGTDLNRELAENLGFPAEKLKDITPNDLFIAAKSRESGVLDTIAAKVDALLNAKREDGNQEARAGSLNAAVRNLGGANMAVISLPGAYAAAEAKKALQNGLHVMLFSDNVSLEDEIEIKKLGREKGLLVMGPDCGTAIVNHVPLCFANVVKKGPIGIVGASGTGTQEVTCQIDRLGGGVSQVIGTGGRDLSVAVGGIMMLEGLKALKEDPETEVIVLISKPPAPDIAKAVLKEAADSKKPVVADFIGGDRRLIESFGAIACESLEDAARKAVCLSQGKIPMDFTGFLQPEVEIDALAKAEAAKLGPEQKYLRALYTGGTLADEAMKILSAEGFDIRSNIPLKPELRLQDVQKSEGHTCIDLGDDAFTVGRPHPMIDPSGRIERLRQEARDGAAAVVLLDFVLGYGSHPDPAGEMLPAIREAKKAAEDRGGFLSVVGSICGTAGDPQDYRAQEQKLLEAGVVLMPSNAQAAKLAAKILKKIGGAEI
jgi:FdrA protein